MHLLQAEININIFMYRIKYTESVVRERIARTVASLREEGIISDQTLFLVMLNGGVWFASHLFDAIPDMMNEVEYIKGHSYSGQSHGELTWDLRPSVAIQNRQVVVLDDICDSGNTTNTVYEALRGVAKDVCFVTLLRRTTAVLAEGVRVYSCIEDDSDDFFVGCGLDDFDKGRMLPFVGVVEKS